MTLSEPCNDGAYWAWSVRFRQWLLVDIKGHKGLVHGMNMNLDVLYAYYDFTDWVGPFERPGEPPRLVADQLAAA